MTIIEGGLASWWPRLSLPSGDVLAPTGITRRERERGGGEGGGGEGEQNLIFKLKTCMTVYDNVERAGQDK